MGRSDVDEEGQHHQQERRATRRIGRDFEVSEIRSCLRTTHGSGSPNLLLRSGASGSTWLLNSLFSPYFFSFPFFFLNFVSIFNLIQVTGERPTAFSGREQLQLHEDYIFFNKKNHENPPPPLTNTVKCSVCLDCINFFTSTRKGNAEEDT